jgi:hypothetical protein
VITEHGVHYPTVTPAYVQLHGVITVTVDAPSPGLVDEGWVLPLPYPWDKVLTTDPWGQTRLLRAAEVRSMATEAQRTAWSQAAVAQTDLAAGLLQRRNREWSRLEYRRARWWAAAYAAVCKFFNTRHLLAVGMPEEGPGMPPWLEVYHPDCRRMGADEHPGMDYDCAVDWELANAGYDAFSGGPPIPEDPGFYPVEQFVNYYPGGPWGDQEVDTGLGVVAGPGIGD